MTFARKRFPVPGGPTLAYDEAGDAAASPVVLVHGLSAARLAWERLGITAGVARGHRVLAVDQRGHGESDRTPGEYLLGNYTVDLVAFLDGVLGEPAVLVGHSLGGLVSAHAATVRPDLVRAAYLLDAPVAVARRSPRPGFAASWRALAHVLRGLHARGGSADDVAEVVASWPSWFGDGTNADVLDADALTALATVWHRFDPDAVSGVLDGRFLDGYDRTRVIACPVHVLRADVDASFRADDEAPFVALHPRATVDVAPGTNHFTLLESEVLLTSLRSFLTGVSRAPAVS